jgi:cytochrome c556
MRSQLFSSHWASYGKCMLLLAASITSGAVAQTAPTGANTAKQAIENRKAVFTLIGNNFRPIAEILRGNLKYEAVDVNKYASRVSFLANFVADAFPEVSKAGDTQAKPEIWSDHDTFEKHVKAFQEHSHALSQLVTAGGADNDAFKAAARAVVQDCKACHEDYRNK